MLLSSSIYSASEWLYYKEYPWVYDAKTEDWLYLQGGTDKKIYAYRASTKVWEEFSIPDDSGETFDTNDPPSTLTTSLNSSTQLDMLWVEPGTFTMGSPTTEAGRSSDETQHQVTLTQGFYLGKYEVTQSQYEAVMNGNSYGLSASPSIFAGNTNRPVEQVSWDDIQVFLSRLNDQQSSNIPAGWEYVLPTEAQWEYACRAGTTTAFSWGDDNSSLRANFGQTSETVDVGRYSANPWGFYDMHGNVREWVADFYDLFTNKSSTNPTGPLVGSAHSTKGGSFVQSPSFSRSAVRYGVSPASRIINYGFRVGFQQQ